MALRIRKNGDIVCAAICPSEPGDTYINDGLHYEMSVLHKVIGAETHDRHALDGRWYWLGNVPDGAEIDEFYLDRDEKLGSVLDGR